MNWLQKLDRQIGVFLQKMVAVGRRNYILWSIERSKKFREMEKEIYQSFLIQTLQFLQTDIFNAIRSRIKKQEENEEEYIWTDADELQIREEVDNKFKSFLDFLSMTALMGFFVWLANKGGQSFLNKVKIKREFDLKDKGILEGLGKKADLLIDGIDATTKAWLVKEIVSGKKEKLGDADIANRIREKIPSLYKYRAQRIVRTESADIVNRMEFETAVRNQAVGKRWKIAGTNVCEVCDGNEANGIIGMNATFSSGDLRPPAHPNCKCLLEYDVPLIIAGQGGWAGE